jgi:hypothetical protein
VRDEPHWLAGQDHHCDTQRYLALLNERGQALLKEPDLHIAFRQEMRRFLPAALVAETVEQPEFWSYLTALVAEHANAPATFFQNRVRSLSSR